MGNCALKRAKPSKNYASSIKITVPDLAYLNRREKTLLVVKSQDSTLIPLKKKAKIFRDSCISTLPDSSIIIAGGSDSSSSLTNWVFQLLPFKNILKSLPPLPIPSKFGNFLHFQHFLYYVGGVCEAQDYSSSQSEQGTPICRLDLEKNKWEVFSEQNEFNPDKYLRRNIMSEDDKSRLSLSGNFNLAAKDLIEPGSAIVDDMLYLIGGRIWVNDQLEATEKIFVVGLEKQFGLSEETLEMPVKISSASCCVSKGFVCVAGGFLWNMAENLDIFLIDFGKKNVRRVALEIDRPLEPRYPVVMDEKGILCFSPPKMMYLREDKQQVFVFSLPTKVNHAEIEVQTTVSQKKVVKTEEKLADEENCVEDVQSFVEIVEKEKEMAEVVGTDEAIEGNFEVFVDNLEITKDKEENCEQNGEDLTKKSKRNRVKCYNCNEKMTRVRKKHENYQDPCEHCKDTRNKHYCSNCDKLLCKSCAKAFQQFPPCTFPVFCSNSHKLCESPSDSSSQCINCSSSNSSLFCFVCNINLCSNCFSSIQSLLITSPTCPLSHQLFFYTQSTLACDKCSEAPETGRFVCEICSYAQCLSCTQPSSLLKIIPCEESSSESVSYNFAINESSLDEILHPKALEVTKKLSVSPFAEIDKRKMPDESEVVDGKIRIQSFATPIEEMKKKIIQKPLRGEKSPLILSLSPKKYPSEEDFERHGARKIVSPRSVLRKSIETISERQIYKKSAHYYLPKPLNPEFRPANFAEPSYKQQIETIKVFLDNSPENIDEIKSGQSTFREALEILSENNVSKGNGECPFALFEEVKLENGFKFEQNEEQNLCVNKNVDQQVGVNISKSVETQHLGVNKSKEQQLGVSICKSEEKQELNSLKVNLDEDESETRIKKPEVQEKEKDDESEEMRFEQSGPEGFLMGSGVIDLNGGECRESESVSLFFPTLGDESEQIIAPAIDKSQANNKLHALKAKLNLLTERSSFSSSSESEKSASFNGFVIGKVKLTSSEESSFQSASKKEFKDISKIVSKDEKSESSSKHSVIEETLKKVKIKIEHSGVYDGSLEMSPTEKKNFQEMFKEEVKISEGSSVYNVKFPALSHSGSSSRNKNLKESSSSKQSLEQSSPEIDSSPSEYSDSSSKDKNSPSSSSNYPLTFL